MDFRSDTVTKPTLRMRQAMFDAEVGDDVYGDDPTVNALEKEVAELLGKEAGLFVPSGTFSNQCAIMTHTRRGDEVIVLEDAHILIHECGAAGVLSGVNLRPARSDFGEYILSDLMHLVRGEDIHYPRTGLICMENAHGNGRAIPLSSMQETYEFAHNHGIPVHLDGARIFNAAVALECKPAEIALYADSVSVCLSKGLCAPVGSVLVGTQEFIDRARFHRKLMGGGMRQAGILAAAGHIAITEMVDRLEEDHALANYVGIALDDMEGIEVLWNRLDINMVFFHLNAPVELSSELLKYNILVNPAEDGEYRIVLNHDVNREDADRLLIAVKEILQSV